MKHENRIHFLTHKTHEWMLSFIIETADGKIIVIDGGTAGDADHLLENLKAVTGSEKPVIDAWFLTHPHLDHTGAFIRFMSEETPLEVKHVYYNFPSRQYLARHDPGIGSTHIDKFYTIRDKIAEIADVVTQGDTYEVGEARFDILYTHDPAFIKEAYNDSSTVIRITLAGQKLLILADLAADGGKKLLAMHGDALKSDFVQMSHHGQGGVQRDVYEAVAPKCCFWCATQQLWDNDVGLGFNTHGWKTIETRTWMQELGVKYHYIIKDGDAHLNLPFAFEE